MRNMARAWAPPLRRRTPGSSTSSAFNKGQCQVRVDKEGHTRVYDAALNLFGSYNPDGTTRTYLAPTGGQAYFDNQEWAMP